MRLSLTARRTVPLLFFGALLVQAGCSGEKGSFARIAIGEAVPAYQAVDISGLQVSLDDLKGDVVLLNIWATWCKPCREEIPALEALWQKHSEDGLRVIGVSIDQPGMEDRVRSFAVELGASYPLWHDPDDRVSMTFMAIGVPASFLIDREGILRWRHVGPVTAEDPALNRALEAALSPSRHESFSDQ